MERSKKLEEKQRKEDEKNEAKQRKIALQQVANSKKPGTCHEFVTVEIDDRLSPYNGALTQYLEAAHFKTLTVSQKIPNSITWKRAVPQLVENALILETIVEAEVVVLMEWKQVSELISENTFQQYVLEQKSKDGSKSVTLALFGLEEYFKYFKKLKKGQKPSGKGPFGNAVRISAKELESQLSELQLVAQVNHRTVESQDDLNAMIYQYSKSLAEAPGKNERRAKEEELQCFVKGSNRDCVKVDENGNGLRRLWQQQLMEFPLMSLEVAEAITNEYPLPAFLFDKLDDLPEEEGELVFQNLLIRRAAGPNAFQRKVGPEISKRIYRFFSSMDGNLALSKEDA